MKIQENVNLSTYTTFQLHAKARFFAEVKSIEDINECLEAIKAKKIPFFILGGGANVAFVKNFPGLVIKIGLLGKEIISSNKEKVLIKVAAGEDWPEFVHWCVDAGYCGIENLAEIPGCVWASPVQNIWAYWTEAREIIKEVHYIDIETGKEFILDNASCNFAYRDSIFKHELAEKIIITHVVFELKIFENWMPLKIDYKEITQYLSAHLIDPKNVTPKMLAEIIKTIRSSKLPDRHKIGTAWSFFKNPIIPRKQLISLKFEFSNIIYFEISEPKSVKLSAWQLIELCWFKWVKRWHVGVYDKHALILVNNGWADGKEISDLSHEIIQAVKTKFGVVLEPEVIMV